MYDCGALGIGETMSDDDLQLCAFRLNLLVKQLMGTIDLAPGLKVWSRKDGNLFLSNTTGTYPLGPDTGNFFNRFGWCTSFTQTTLATTAAAGVTIVVSSLGSIANGDNIGVSLSDGSIFWTTVSGSPVGTTVTILEPITTTALSGALVYNYSAALQARRPLKILTAVLRDSNSNDTPLWLYNLQDYESLPSKTNIQNSGDPTTIFYQANLVSGTLKTDVAAAADTSKYIHMVYLSPIEDFNSATDTPDYPQEWYRPLVKNLAVEIAPAFSLPVTPEMVQAKAEAMAIAGRSNPETSSMFFMPKNDDYMPWGTF
jgi:hypothetical protein